MKKTADLLDTMKTSRDYDSYLKANGGELSRSFVRVDRALTSVLAEKQLKKAEVIARSGLEVHYAYQIFNGTKTPTRDKVVMLCIGMGLSADETQRLLEQCGYPQLYGRIGRDNAILYGITRHQSVMDINSVLYEAGYELLI